MSSLLEGVPDIALFGGIGGFVVVICICGLVCYCKYKNSNEDTMPKS